MIRGILLGMVLGIFPGLHINNFAPFLTGYSGMLIIFVSAVVANFFEFFKASVFFSPDEGEVLLTNPVSKMISQGRMLYALKLFIIGALMGVFICSLLSPLLFVVLPFIYYSLKNLSYWFILLIAIHLIMKDKNPAYAFLLFIFSGILGIFAFNYVQKPLAPMLTGLFGMSSLISIKRDFPEQMKKIAFVAEKREVMKGSFIGFFSSLLLSIVPAIGPSQASLVGAEFEKEKKEEVFLTSIGSINTSDVFLSLMLYMSIGKARIGAFNYLMQNPAYLYILIFYGLISSILVFVLIIYLAPKIIDLMAKMDIEKMKIMLLSIICPVIYIISGISGMLLLILSTALGHFFEKKTIKSHAMGCIMLPVLMSYL